VGNSIKIIIIINRGNWNHFKILQKILEQRTGTARYQGTAENSYIGHSTHCGKC
jgi:hypothetical protein